jgi:hypothetical protein
MHLYEILAYMSAKILNKPSLIGRIVDYINVTRSGREMEQSTTEDTQEHGLSTVDLENILSVTQDDPSFDEIVNDVINKYLIDQPAEQESAQTSSSSEKAQEAVMLKAPMLEEIPIKQRLRPRSEKFVLSTQKAKKINIISNEPYTGVIPTVANMIPVPLNSAIANGIGQNPEIQQQLLLNMPVFVQSGDTISLLQAALADGTMTTALMESQTTTSVAMVHQQEAQKKTFQNTEPIVIDKKEQTPKTVLYPSFLESKSKSASRDKNTHVRILDFNQTPGLRKFPSIPECTTPSNRTLMQTPGSAPANLSIYKSSKKEPVLKVVKENATQPIENMPESMMEDNSNSNSNSISCTIDKWISYRNECKTLPIDQQVRMSMQRKQESGTVKKKRTTENLGNRRS